MNMVKCTTVCIHVYTYDINHEVLTTDCFVWFNLQHCMINRKQEVPHDGPMCDLLWSDPEGKSSF